MISYWQNCKFTRCPTCFPLIPTWIFLPWLLYLVATLHTFFLLPASMSSILKHPFLWPLFFGTVNTIVLSPHPSAVWWAAQHCCLCIVLVAQNYSRGFQLTLLRMQGALLIIIVVIPAPRHHTKNQQQHPPSRMTEIFWERPLLALAWILGFLHLIVVCRQSGRVQLLETTICVFEMWMKSMMIL